MILSNRWEMRRARIANCKATVVAIRHLGRQAGNKQQAISNDTAPANNDYYFSLLTSVGKHAAIARQPREDRGNTLLCVSKLYSAFRLLGSLMPASLMLGGDRLDSMTSQ